LLLFESIYNDFYLILAASGLPTSERESILLFIH